MREFLTNLAPSFLLSDQADFAKDVRTGFDLSRPTTPLSSIRGKRPLCTSFAPALLARDGGGR